MASEITYAEVKFKNNSSAAVIKGKELDGLFRGRRPGERGAEEQGMEIFFFCDSGSYLVLTNW